MQGQQIIRVSGNHWSEGREKKTIKGLVVREIIIKNNDRKIDNTCQGEKMKKGNKGRITRTISD